MTFTEVSDLFPGAKVHMYATGFQVVGDGWTIRPPLDESTGHLLIRENRAPREGTLAELHTVTAGNREARGFRAPPESESPAPVSAAPAGTGGEGCLSWDPKMSNDDYHAHESLGSTTVKTALFHPGRIGAPTQISDRARFDGNRMHTAVCEPEEMHHRYVVPPKPSDYPFAIEGSNSAMCAALKDAGVKGYSGKKKDQLVEMCREHLPTRNLWTDVLSDFSRNNGGKQFVSEAEWDEMHRVADAVMAHPVIQSEGIFSKGVGEASFFAEVEFPNLFGSFKMKARPDWLQHDRVTDLKTWKGGKPLDAFRFQADSLHYDLSAAHYLAVLEAHGRNPDNRFTWVVVDKSTMSDGGHVVIHVATLSPKFLAQGREKLECALERISLWENAPRVYETQHQIEHIAEPPRREWRTGL